MSEPELIAGKWVERRVYVGGTNACGRCAFGPSKCRSTYHDGRTVRAHCDGIYFVEVKEPQPMETTPVKPQAQPTHAQPTAKQLAADLESLTKAEETLALLRKQHRLFAEQPMRYGFSLASHQSHGKVILRNSATNTAAEVESALLRQAFEVHQEALLQTLLDLHAQQVAEMKTALSEQLLDMAVEYRK